MRIKLPARELKQALTGLLKIIPRKSNLSILHGIRIEAAEDTVRLTATDLDSTVYYACQNATVLESGLVVIADARRLKQLIAHVVKDEAEIAAVNEQPVRLTLHGEMGEREQLLTAADFIDWPADPPLVRTHTSGSALLAGYRSLLPYISKDLSRAILGGVCLDNTNKKRPVLVATDGRQLSAIYGLELPLSETCVVPAHRFLAWTQLVGECRIGTTPGGWFRLECGPWTFQCKSLEGNYPAWRSVVPEPDGVNGIDLHESDIPLLQETLRTMPCSDRTNKPLSIVRQGTHPRIRALDPETATWCNRDLLASQFHGEASTCINREFFGAALRTGFRNFRWQDSLSPLVGHTEDDRLHVLMPLRADAPPKPANKNPTQAKPQPA